MTAVTPLRAWIEGDLTLAKVASNLATFFIWFFIDFHYNNGMERKLIKHEYDNLIYFEIIEGPVMRTFPTWQSIWASPWYDTEKMTREATTELHNQIGYACHNFGIGFSPEAMAAYTEFISRK